MSAGECPFTGGLMTGTISEISHVNWTVELPPVL